MRIKDWFRGRAKSDINAVEKVPTVDPAELERVIMNAGLGRTLSLIGSTPRVLWRQFLSGVIWGIGYFVGLTVGVALLVWVISQVADFPYIGEYATKLGAIIDSYPTPAR